MVRKYCRLAIPQLAHKFGARPLHKFQVIDVVNNTRRVGIFYIHPNGQFKYLHFVMPLLEQIGTSWNIEVLVGSPGHHSAALCALQKALLYQVGL